MKMVHIVPSASPLQVYGNQHLNTSHPNAWCPYVIIVSLIPRCLELRLVQINDSRVSVKCTVV